MRVYIAGPMRGKPNCNFAAFDVAAAKWRAAGHDVVSPAENDRAEGFRGDSAVPRGFVNAALARDIPLLLACDALVVLPGWENSAGASAERALAKALDPPLPIYRADNIPLANHKQRTPRLRRETFTTGAQRDSREGKGRYDLLPPRATHRKARVCERGAASYGERNWEKGMPISRFIDSAMRHVFQYLRGKADEDHLAQAAWNLDAALETEERIGEGLLPGSLSDLQGVGQPCPLASPLF